MANRGNERGSGKIQGVVEVLVLLLLLDTMRMEVDQQMRGKADKTRRKRATP